MATIPGVADGELIRTSWGDAVADELNGNTVKLTGDHTMAGSLSAPLFLSVAQDSSGNAATRKDYVDSLAADRVSTFGDTMTGQLTVGGNPYGEQQGSALTTASIAALRNVVGVNLELFKAGAAFSAGQHFVGFYGQNTSTPLGAITQASASSVLYNTSSDYRLKDDLGLVIDPVDRLMRLQPKHLRWKSDQSEFDGFIAHEVDEVVPEAVTGAKDAMHGNRIAPQMLDTKALIPLLTAALQEAHTQIAALTARLDALEAAS